MKNLLSCGIRKLLNGELLTLLVLTFCGLQLLPAYALKSDMSDILPGGAEASTRSGMRARTPSAQQQAAAKIVSAAGAKVMWHSRFGTPTSVRGADLGRLQAVLAGNKGLAVKGNGAYALDAVAVLDNLASLFKVQDAEKEFNVSKVESDNLGFHHVRLNQTFKSLRVVGGHLAVHFNKAGTAYEVSGQYIPDIELGVVPVIGVEDAVQIALDDLAAMGGAVGKMVGMPEQVVFARGMEPRLAFELTLSCNDPVAGPGRWRYWIDGLRGTVLLRYNDIKKISPPTTNGTNTMITGSVLVGEGGALTNVLGWYENTGNNYLYSKVRNWYVYNVATGGYSDAGTFAYRTTGSWGTSDRAEMSLAANFEVIQRYYTQVHGLNSFDGSGTFAGVNVHEGDQYVNAFWDGDAFYFGDGDGVEANSLGVLDVAGHEFTHAVTEFSANLVYQYESGALNESFSDILGSCIEFFGQADDRSSYPNRHAGQADWLCGEDCWLSSTALRDLRNPANSATVGVGYEQPTRYLGTYWYDGPADNGGVHQNSGVQNLFFYLLCEGGSGNNDGITYSVTGIGVKNAERVAYRALTVYCTQDTDYRAARNAWLSAAEDLNAAWVGSVGAAWDAVGVRAVYLTPESDASFAGQEGGPFAPSAVFFKIMNSSSSATSWGVGHSQPWLSVSPESGTIPAFGSQMVTLTLGTTVPEMHAGDYVDTLLFTNSSGSLSESRLVSLSVRQPSVYEFNLDTNPGWTTEGQWAYGTPQGLGGDPMSGATGSKVYGYNLNGAYTTNMPIYALTTPALNCSKYKNIQLSFQRWLGVESAYFDHATIQVSTNGTVWADVWNNPDDSIRDTSWTNCVYSLPGVDGQGVVYLRWLMGPTDDSVQYSGWNIDDIQILGTERDNMIVWPRTALNSQGYQGGPFSPTEKMYSVVNSGTTALNWTVVTTSTWLSVSSAGGVLAPGATGTVTVVLSPSAGGLSPGQYQGFVFFNNSASGYGFTRSVSLTILEIPGEISVTDSIAPAADLNMPFGPTIVGLSRKESVTVSNLDSTHDLVVTQLNVRTSGTIAGVRLPLFTGEIGGRQTAPASFVRAPRTTQQVIEQSATLAAPSDVPCFGINMMTDQLVSYRTSDPGSLTTIAATGGDLMVGVDFLNGDFSRLYALDYDAHELVRFDTVTGVKTVVGAAEPLPGHSWTGQAGDPSGQLYACSTDGSESYLYTIDPQTGAVAEIGLITECPLIIDIAINAAGEMYGVDIALDSLVRIDKETGAATVVGALGIDANYAQGLDFDEDNNVLYWAAYSTTAELRVIDTSTGNSALVSAFPAAAELNIAIANGGSGCFQVDNAPTLPCRIPPGGNVTFDVTYHPVKVGTNLATLVIASNDKDEPTVAVALSGQGIPEYLTILPETGLSGSGHPGGPFSPADQIYVVSNNSAVGISWAAVSRPSWVTVTPASGSLAAGASAPVTVAFGPDAAVLSEGLYNDVVMFSNLTTTLTQSRPLALEVFTTPVVRVAPAAITVTNLLGQTRQTPLQVGNAAWADAVLDFTLSASEVNRTPLQAATALAAGQDFTQLPEKAEYREGKLLVRFTGVTTGAQRLQALAAAGGGTVTRNYKLVPGLTVVELPEGTALATALARFNQTPGIQYAQPIYRQKLLRTPNDPLFADLWGMDNASDTDINAPEAWERGVGGPAVTVAVIDTGVDYAHEDLAANMWRNTGEIPGNGLDDDGNGYVDDVYGYDFYNRDADPMDDHDHGTHCAGTIGGVGDNGVGVAGVCWNVKIMALKFISKNDEGYTDDAISCIEYAVMMGARVLSNSWGGGPYEQALKDAIDAAGAADVLFVAAAGNDYGNDNDSNPAYPASYESDNLIAVLSVDDAGAVSYFSNFGLESVDLGAPGSDILSCKRNGGYQYMSGTSMATPHVSGACALLLSLNSGFSCQQVKNALLATTDSSLPGLCVSGGRMNLAEAVTYTPAWLSVSPVSGESVAPGAWSSITVTADAGTLAAGTYEGLISVRCNDRATPVTNVPVKMVVLQDNLAVQPYDAFVASGYKGGPFTPVDATYTLSNTGLVGLAWTATSGHPWVSVSPAGGTLAAGQTVQVTVSLNLESGLLSPGEYMDSVVFSNVTSTALQRREVELTVLERVFDHLEWAPLTSTQYVGEPFGVTVKALDPSGSVYSNFTGTVSLYAQKGVASQQDVLTGTADWGYPMYTYYHDARTQVIYLNGELGAPGLLTSLSLYVSGVPGQTMNAWTIRLKHTSLAGYSSSAKQWETNDWIVALQTNMTIQSTGWVKFDFTTPFIYNGTDNLLVDFSFNNTFWTSEGYCWSTLVSTNRSLYYRTDSGFGDPLTWSGTTPSGTITNRVPVMRIDRSEVVPISPTETGNFINGVWNGTLTVQESASNVTLYASDRAGHLALSAPFDAVGGATTSHGTSYSWLDLYGLVSGGNYEAADLADADGDGHAAWQEYKAGTVPTNRFSVLQMQAVIPGSGTGGIHVNWQSVAGKHYWVESCETLTYPIFFTPFVSNVLGQAGSTEVMDNRPAVNGSRFYRVGVQ